MPLSAAAGYSDVWRAIDLLRAGQNFLGRAMNNLFRISRRALGVLAALAFPAHAHAEAHFDAGARLFRLDGGSVTYAFGVNAAGALQSVYWGPRLAPADRL